MTFKHSLSEKSPAGEKIFKVLSDGNPHLMILTIQFRKDKDEDCVWISQLVSDKPWVYDETLADRCTSPILAPHPQIQAEPAEIPKEAVQATERKAGQTGESARQLRKDGEGT